MTSRERQLMLFMRLAGVVTGTAIFFVFVPYSVMNAIHDGWLGMGTLPTDPIVGYLARSLSAFYAMMGGLFIFLSFDVKRYRNAILYVIAFSFAFALMVGGIDIVEGLPPAWRYGEGPCVLVLSAVGYVLWRRAGEAA